MKRIIIHWTAGVYSPNSHELNCYHNGKFKPESNEICRFGQYAAHTGGGNTGSIGVAMCGMLGFCHRNNVGKYPIKAKQFEATMKLCSDLAKKYNIPIKSSNIMTHYEFGRKNPRTTSAGKIDLIYIPSYPWVAELDVGSFIRTKIKWYSLKELVH